MSDKVISIYEMSDKASFDFLDGRTIIPFTANSKKAMNHWRSQGSTAPCPPGLGVGADYFIEHTYLHVTQLIALIGQTSSPRSHSDQSRIFEVNGPVLIRKRLRTTVLLAIY